jgi:hypothetical protein
LTMNIQLLKINYFPPLNSLSSSAENHLLINATVSYLDSWFYSNDL